MMIRGQSGKIGRGGGANFCLMLSFNWLKLCLNVGMAWTTCAAANVPRKTVERDSRRIVVKVDSCVDRGQGR